MNSISSLFIYLFIVIFFFFCYHMMRNRTLPPFLICQLLIDLCGIKAFSNQEVLTAAAAADAAQA